MDNLAFTDGDVDDPTDPLYLNPRLGGMLDAGDPLDVTPRRSGVLSVIEEPHDAVYDSSSTDEGMKNKWFTDIFISQLSSELMKRLCTSVLRLQKMLLVGGHE